MDNEWTWSTIVLTLTASMSTLKMLGVIDWSWWSITFPVWGSLTWALITGILLLFVHLFTPDIEPHDEDWFV